MKALQLVSVIVFACFSSSYSDVSKAPKSIKGTYELDSRNFDSSVGDGNVWLIEFYASWCGHCKNFEMEYETVALAVHERNYREEKKVKTYVAKVDGDAEKAIASRFGITGYPSFYVVDGWNVYEYDGPRTRQDLTDFATGEYKKYQPIPFLFSPTGPTGQFRALFMYLGTCFIDFFDWLKTKFGMSPVFTACILLAGFTVTTFIGMIIIAILLTPKAKVD